MRCFIVVFTLFTFWCRQNALPLALNNESPVFHTVFEPNNITEDPISTVPVSTKPHHLFVGRCLPEHSLLHAETIILNNDGRSYVNATITMKVDGPERISCVKVQDNVPGGYGGYPSYLDGGVDRNFISIAVATAYGRGFNFYVEIYGYEHTPNQTQSVETNNKNEKI